MCYRISNKATKKALQERYGASFADKETIAPYYHLAAFIHPKVEVLTTESPTLFNAFTWGFIPPWEKSYANALQRMLSVANARAEELGAKASFKDAWAKGQRCLIPVTGFFESHTLASAKGKPLSIPYFIHLPDREIFSLAGIFNTWTDPETAEVHPTISMLTVEANPLMKLVHNIKERMPLILPLEHEQQWLDPKFSAKEANELIRPYPAGEMHAYTVNNNIHNPKTNANQPEALDPYNYEQYMGSLPEF